MSEVVEFVHLYNRTVPHSDSGLEVVESARLVQPIGDVKQACGSDW